MFRPFLVVLTLIAALVAGSLPAAARARVFLDFNFPLAAPYYGPPAYYAPPPAYYYPPAYAYYPPPAYAAPAAPAANCRTYHGDASIDASGEPFYGTACLGADGRWHIVD